MTRFRNSFAAALLLAGVAFASEPRPGTPPSGEPPSEQPFEPGRQGIDAPSDRDGAPPSGPRSDRPVETPIGETPPAGGRPRTRDDAAEGASFLDKPLAVAEAEMTGTLADEDGGLGAALWQGATCETATDALAALNVRAGVPLPGIADLARRLALSRTAIPPGCTPASQFLAARICLLGGLGFHAEAALLMETEPGARADCRSAPGIRAEPASQGERLAEAIGTLAETCAAACDESALRILQDSNLSREAAQIVQASEKAREKSGGG